LFLTYFVEVFEQAKPTQILSSLLDASVSSVEDGETRIDKNVYNPHITETIGKPENQKMTIGSTNDIKLGCKGSSRLRQESFYGNYFLVKIHP
jgi:hypothetical protein